jgi:putative DNA primase/helicase
LLGIDFTLQKEGWINCRIESETYRLDIDEPVTIRSKLFFHFNQDFPSADVGDRKQLSEAFNKFWTENEKEIREIIESRKPKEVRDPPTKDNAPEIMEMKTDQKSAILASWFLQHGYFICLEDTKELYRYNDGIYEPNAEMFIWKILGTLFDRKEVSTNLVNEVIAHVKRPILAKRDIFVEHNPHIVLANGMFNLDPDKWKFEDFTPEYKSLNKLPVEYHKEADCPNFKQFINQILAPEDVQGVQEELGAILIKQYLTKKLSIYVGETDTGKTTLISVFTALFGEENLAHVPIQRLAAKDRFSMAELHGRVANIVDDLSRDVVHTTGVIKQLTGQSPIMAEKKFQAPFKFVNYAYMIFACNAIPMVEGDDDAFFNRVIIRNFNKRFGGNSKPNRNLINDLTTPEELSGILNWALEGLKRLRDNGWNFTNTQTLDATREEYIRKSDPIASFVKDCIEEDSESWITKEELYNSFREYSSKNHIPLLSRDYFFKHFPEKTSVRTGYKGDKGSQKQAFIGVKFADTLIGKSARTTSTASTTLDQSPLGTGGTGGTSSFSDLSKVETFTHIEPLQLGFGGDCELCGKRSVAAYRSSEGYLCCKDCAKGEGEIPKS